MKGVARFADGCTLYRLETSLVPHLPGMLPYGSIAPLAALVLWTFLVLMTGASIMLYRRLQTTAPSPI